MKRTIGRIFALLYIAIVLVCITFVIKPGASIFYFKHTIGNQELVPDVGFAYRYKLEAKSHFLTDPRYTRIRKWRATESVTEG